MTNVRKYISKVTKTSHLEPLLLPPHFPPPPPLSSSYDPLSSSSLSPLSSPSGWRLEAKTQKDSIFFFFLWPVDDRDHVLDKMKKEEKIEGWRWATICSRQTVYWNDLNASETNSVDNIYIYIYITQALLLFID